jgi:cell division septation protein DedD
MATAPTTALDNTDEHSTTALFRAAIGAISNGYYLPRFTRFEVADRPGLSWNWAAALNTLNWLMFRQLWHAALVYSGSIVALALVLFGIGKLVFQFSQGTQWGLLAALVGLAFVLPGLGGNALYYMATRQRVQNALVKNQTVAEACIQLGKQASTRKGLVVIAVCNAVVLVLGVQSYRMFSGFEPLPVGTPIAVNTAPDARNVASGLALDVSGANAAKAPASSASAAAVATSALAAKPATAASAALTPASKPTATASAPASAMLAASAPANTAKPATAPASAPTKAQVLPAPGAYAATARAANVPASAPVAPQIAAATSSKVAPRITAPASAETTSPMKASSDKAPKALPAPMALRSAAAESAAREVAAARGQSAPVPPVATRTTATTDTPAPAAANRFVVNVGLFADANNARNALVKLMDADLPVVSKEIRFPKGNRTRVQVGPFDTLAEADAAADKVRALELEARVAPLP